jgi:hypothetical protein
MLQTEILCGEAELTTLLEALHSDKQPPENCRPFKKSGA